MPRVLLSCVCVLGVALCGALPGPVQAQELPAGPGLGAYRDTLRLGAGSAFAPIPRGIVPRSARVLRLDSLGGETPLDTALVRLDLAAGALRLAQPVQEATRLVIEYRRLPLVEAVGGRVPVLVRDTTGPRMPRAAPRAPPAEASAGPGLRTTGSVTRGVVSGSNRDVSLTSGLRLELGGEVAPGVTVEGVLTDSDTPIVPEGTTQALSDFDRVYVRVDAPGASAQLGDVDLVLGGTAFAPLSRKVQGAAASASLPRGGLVAGGRVEVAGSAVRGQYRSQELVLLDGVQGPYRLEGDAGERFVLVVPGSERVFWDGRPVVRGRDYTIDYATGELTFTPERLVTAERRASVDFEYSAGGYARTLAAADASVELWPAASGRARASVGARWLREADAPGLGDALGLSDADLDALAAAGRGDVFVPGETRVPFDPASPAVLYARADTLLDGVRYSIFVPARAAADSVFRVRFTRVDAGTGDYRRVGQAANGLLYEWVGPGSGDYVARRRLPRPAARQVLDLRGALAPIPGVELAGEWALGADDANTLSPSARTQAQASDLALRVAPQRVGRWGTVSGELRRRDRAAEFRSLDRVRRVDFARRWNLSRTGAPRTAALLDTLGERLTEAELVWAPSLTSRASVQAGRVGLEGYRADRLAVDARLAEPGLPTLGYELVSVESAADGAAVGLGGGFFLRQAATVSQAFLGGRLTPTLALAQEGRVETGQDLPADTLLAPSYAFVSARPGVAWASGRLRASGGVEVRRDREPLGPIGTVGSRVDAAQTLAAEADVLATGAAGARVEGRVAYRRTDYNEAFRAVGRQSRESLALRTSARVSPLDRGLRVSAQYEALTERTPVLQEAYVLVGAEAGQFVWRDGEGEPRAGEPDGVAQVDEFFPETTPYEGLYVRTFVPGDALLPSVGVRARAQVDGDGAALAERLGLPALAGVATRTLVEVRERSLDRDLARVLRLDPAVLQQQSERVVGGDTLAAATVDGRFRVEQDVTLGARSAERSLRLSASHLSSTRRLAAGLETRRVQSARADGRLRVSPAWGLRAIAMAGRRASASDAFASRTFDLREWSAEPSATWTPSSGLSVTVGLLVSRRTDAAAAAGRPTAATVLRLPASARVDLGERLALTLRAEASSVELDGGAGGGLALFELTDGRGPGRSFLGGGSLQALLPSGLRASVTYDLRVPSGARAIQTLRASLTAVF